MKTYSYNFSRLFVCALLLISNNAFAVNNEEGQSVAGGESVYTDNEIEYIQRDPAYYSTFDPIPLPSTLVYSQEKQQRSLMKENKIEEVEAGLTIPDRDDPEFPQLNDANQEKTSRRFTGYSKINYPQNSQFTRRNVKLFITQPNGDRGVCSGALVAPDYVLTAGHCVYDKGASASTIEVVPAYTEGKRNPYGSTYATRMFWFNRWQNEGDFNWDIALIKLNKPIGNSTGWYGFGYNSNCSVYQNQKFRNYSYPAESLEGTDLYYRYGGFDRCSNNVAIHYDNSEKGSSGGAYINNNQQIYAILSHGRNNDNDTGAVKLNTTMYNWILIKTRDSACFYEHDNYRGRELCKSVNREQSYVGSFWNDRISSIKVNNACISIYLHREFRGNQASGCGTFNVPSLSRFGWNDHISSYRVLRN